MRNPVAKHAHKFNKANVFEDKRRRDRLAGRMEDYEPSFPLLSHYGISIEEGVVSDKNLAILLEQVSHADSEDLEHYLSFRNRPQDGFWADDVEDGLEYLK